MAFGPGRGLADVVTWIAAATPAGFHLYASVAVRPLGNLNPQDVKPAAFTAWSVVWMGVE